MSLQYFELVKKKSPIDPEDLYAFVPRFCELPTNVESGDMSSSCKSCLQLSRKEGVFKIVSQILLSLRISLQVTIQILSPRARQEPGESPKFGDQLSSKLGTFLSNLISGFLKPPEPPLGVEELKRVPEEIPSFLRKKNTIGGTPQKLFW